MSNYIYAFQTLISILAECSFGKKTNFFSYINEINIMEKERWKKVIDSS